MVIFKWLLNLLKCLIYHIIKDKKVCLCRVWVRLTTAYLLCAREFRQNNALALQFWCLSNALTLRVRALDASKSQRACIILSKFTRIKVNTQLLIYNSDVIAVHRSTIDVDRCTAMPSLVAVVSLSDEGRHRAMSRDVGRCTTMEVWTHNKSPIVLKWHNINGAFRLHRYASVDEYLCTQRGWPRAKGHVGKCRLMQSNRSLNAQHNYI